MRWTEQPIYFVDFEGSRASGILEFGVAEVLGGKITSARTRLCRAMGPVRPEDVAVHGLQEAALTGEPPLADDLGDLGLEHRPGLRAATSGRLPGPDQSRQPVQPPAGDGQCDDRDEESQGQGGGVHAHSLDPTRQ